MRRLLALLLTVLGCWLGSGSAGLAYAGPASPVSTYTYDGFDHTAPVNDITTERGPPAAYDRGTAYDAVDRWSRGVPARSDGATPATTTTYDTHPTLVEVTRVTSGLVGVADRDVLWLERSGVAAKFEDGAFRLIGANRATIDPRKLTEYALNPNHPVGGNKARVFESALGFNRSNADDLMAQLRQGVMENTPIPGKVDKWGTRFTVDIPVTGPAGSGIVRTGWIYKPGSTTPSLNTLMVR